MKRLNDHELQKLPPGPARLIAAVMFDAIEQARRGDVSAVTWLAVERAGALSFDYCANTFGSTPGVIRNAAGLDMCKHCEVLARDNLRLIDIIQRGSNGNSKDTRQTATERTGGARQAQRRATEGTPGAAAHAK